MCYVSLFEDTKVPFFFEIKKYFFNYNFNMTIKKINCILY